MPDRIRTYTDSVRRGLKGHYYEPDLFKGIWEFESIEEAARAAEEGMPLLKKDVLLHGDYCLPNIILNDWKFSGYIKERKRMLLVIEKKYANGKMSMEGKLCRLSV